MVLWLDGGNRLEGETENICVCAKERKGVSAEVLIKSKVDEFLAPNPLAGLSAET